MGANDDREMLEAARAECVRLERVPQAIRDLLGEFTDYPESGKDFSIRDHMFLDFEFWDRLVDIIDPGGNQ